MNAAAAFTTYIRKIGDGQFEYGWHRPAKNFRKQNDEHIAAGVLATVAAAEAARTSLPSQPAA